MRYFVSLVLWISLVLPVQAQQWAGILDPTRAIDWSSAGIPEGIPARPLLCTTLGTAGQLPTFAQSVTAAQVSAAITACAPDRTVKLSPGTYTFTNGVTFGGKNNVTLRGSGPTQTIINFTGGSTVCDSSFISGSICLWSGNNLGLPWPAFKATTNVTAGLAKGSTVLTVASTANLVAGDIGFIDQTDDAADTGGVFNCLFTSTCAYGGTGGASRVGRSQFQMFLIVSVGVGTVTVSPGLYGNNWRVGQSPQFLSLGNPITLSGVEDLRMNLTGASAQAGIMVLDAYKVWIKNVVTTFPNSPRNHHYIENSKNVEVRNSYLYEAQNHASESYGVELFASGDSLVVNNIADRVTSAWLMTNCTGCVVIYNHAIHNTYTPSANWMQGDLYYHMNSQFGLHEGNSSVMLIGDNVHGPGQLGTIFRNNIIGWETGKDSQTIPIQLYNNMRGFNVIGNVVGQPGYHTVAVGVSPASGAQGQVTTQTYGYGANGGGAGAQNAPDDPVTGTTLMRCGNYDVVTGVPVWNSSQCQPGAATYINANVTTLATTHVLPASFYYAALPSAWWATPYGTPPWPPIGPDVTGGNVSRGTGAESLLDGHAYKIPAQLCYENQTSTGGILNHDGNTCYLAASGDITPPSAPTNLRFARKGVP